MPTETCEDVRRRLTGPRGRWRRPLEDGFELFDLGSVPVTRYLNPGNFGCRVALA